MNNIPIVDGLDINDFAREQISRCWLQIISTALGNPVLVPLLVARGYVDRPIVGITAALHGNELNGVPVIQQLFRELDPTKLRGTVVGVPVLNVPSFLENERIFTDDVDLNRIMPGKQYGNESEVYAFRLLHGLLKKFDYHLDYHTASAGRTNCHYIRADMAKEPTASLARLHHADILLHTTGKDGTLRPVLADYNIPSVTVELYDPHVFQKFILVPALQGIYNTFYHLDMLEGEIVPPTFQVVECTRSRWDYTDRGGILDVLPDVLEMVTEGQVVAHLTNVFGDIVHEYTAPESGIVIGKSVNPVNQTGGRILHLGIVKS